MKILHVCQMVGGLDVYVRNIMTYTSDDLEFVLVHGKDDHLQPVMKNGRNIREYGIRLYRSLNPIDDGIALLQTIRIIMKEKPDVIHCHSSKGGFIGRWAGFLTGVRTLYTPNAFSFLSTDSRYKKQLYIWLERSARLRSWLLACSESELILGIEKVGYSKEKALTWHNAVPDASKADIATKTGGDKPYICFIGRPSFQKNTFFLLDVVREVHKRHPEVKFYLLGVGHYSPDVEELKQKVVQYGLADTFELVSWLGHEETWKYVDDSLFYLTVSRYEGLPQAVIEALSLGKAVVASDVVGNRDCVWDQENGYLLPLDVSVFVEKICLLIENGQLREEMGRKSRSLFEREFLIENRIGYLETIYKEM